MEPLDSEVDQPRIERAVREILAAIGEDPQRDGLRETPARVARMYAELFSGLRATPAVHLKKVFEEKYDELVLVRDITLQQHVRASPVAVYGSGACRLSS